MGEVIKFESFKFPWREVLTLDSESSTLQVYVNDQTGEAEIVQMNDDDDAIRTQLTRVDAALLVAALSPKEKR